MATHPVIALLTDFGARDSYVASMKGVILAGSPSASIVDISHSVKPGDISQAAFLLWSAYRHFPRNTIFVCVVDPGVGTSRKVLCVSGDGHKFLAPDNGLLKYVLGSFKKATCFELKSEKYFNKEVSPTFHGRDIFAPVAAHLSKGLKISALGPKCTLEFGGEHFVRVDERLKRNYEGRVLHIDNFGNIITSFLIDVPTEGFRLEFGAHSISKFCSTYAAGSGKRPFMIRGSSGLLEISVKNKSAAGVLAARLNQKIKLYRI